MRIVGANHRGFTILEIMTAIAVLGVLLGMGVPSFNAMARSNRTTNQTNDLLTALTLARSEATKRGMPVAVCAASDATQTACANADTADWRFGWIVFSDRTGAAGEIDGADDRVLQVSRIVSGGMAVISDDVGFVRFGPQGAPTPTPAAETTFDVQHHQCSGESRRRISINRFTGRVSLAKASCT